MGGEGEGKCLHWRLVTVKAWIAIYVLLASRSQNTLQDDRTECKTTTVYLNTLSQLHVFFIYIRVEGKRTPLLRKSEKGN
jgi:hypothetical protein